MRRLPPKTAWLPLRGILAAVHIDVVPAPAALSCRLVAWALSAACSVLSCAGEPDRIAFPDFTVASARDYLSAVARDAQRRGDNDPELTFMEARFQRRLGRHDEAERLAAEASSRNPDRADIRAFQGELLMQRDRLEEALGHLSRAVELDPKLAGGHRRLGMVLDRLGQHERAREAFKRAIALAPADAQALLLLGRLLLNDGNAEEAVAQLKRACELDPQSANAFYVLAQAQNRLEQREAAQETLRIFGELKERDRVAWTAANAARDNGKEVRAIAVSLHCELADYSLNRQRAPLAEAHLLQAARIAPAEPLPHEMLAALYLKNGQAAKARSACEALVRLRPGHAGYRANLGALLLQMKDHPAAIEQLKRALELDPRQPEALNNMARFSLANRRDLPQALDWCRRLAGLQPTAANHDLLAWACYANGQISEARSASAKSIELDPQNPVYKERYRRLKELP